MLLGGFARIIYLAGELTEHYIISNVLLMISKSITTDAENVSVGG